MSSTIPFITLEHILTEDFVRNTLYPDLETTYYWSDSFNPDLYIALAKKGLISTSCNYKGVGDILLPEMQEAYALLDFSNLHRGKKVKKLFNSHYRMETAMDLETVIPLLNRYHGDDSWLTPSYIDLLYQLKTYTLIDNNFELLTTILYSDNQVAAGEIGYFIGNTYTSLTGFYNRDFNNWGTFQLVLLADDLERRGVDFWNMGHPYMEYKKKLGAQILTREDFLRRWQLSTGV